MPSPRLLGPAGAGAPRATFGSDIYAPVDVVDPAGAAGAPDTRQTRRRIQQGGVPTKARQKAFSLVELLVGAALVAIIGLTIATVLSALLGSERFYLAQTDRYESLRLPATLIVEDSRYAHLVDCALNRLTLYQDDSLNDYIEYRLLIVGSGPAYRLRREVNIGGVSTLEFVAHDLAVSAGTKSRFYCPFTDQERSVQFTLVRRPIPGSSTAELRYQGTALLR